MSAKTTETEMSRDDLRLQKAQKFLKSGENFSILYNLLEKSRYNKKKVSIRTLEWFVVNHAESKDISYNLEEARTESSERFQVNKSYQDQLRIYTKRAFDPFCRGKQCREFTKKFKNGDKEVILTLTTNLAQLNFFMWAISNRVLDYIVDNYVHIMKCKKIAERLRRNAKGSRNKLIDSASSDTDSQSVDNDTISKGKRSSKMGNNSISDNDVRNIPTSSAIGSRRKRQGEVIVHHYEQGIACPMP
jgi:hypothetical protein